VTQWDTNYIKTAKLKGHEVEKAVILEMQILT
jgi:hypothetical protein